MKHKHYRATRRFSLHAVIAGTLVAMSACGGDPTNCITNEEAQAMLAASGFTVNCPSPACSNGGPGHSGDDSDGLAYRVEDEVIFACGYRTASCAAPGDTGEGNGECNTLAEVHIEYDVYNCYDAPGGGSTTGKKCVINTTTYPTLASCNGPIGPGLDPGDLTPCAEPPQTAQ